MLRQMLSRMRGSRLLALALAMLLLFVTLPLPTHAVERVGIVDVDYTLNVRTGPGTGYSRIDSLSNGAVVTILSEHPDSTGTSWYKVQYRVQGQLREGYIISTYVIVTSVSDEPDFEQYLTSQNFPESYKPGLRVLHALYPQWRFVAVHTGLEWSEVLAAETVVGRNLVHRTSPGSWINTRDVDSYGRQIARDGSNWVAASNAITAYSLDPRNFLSDPYILQFESLTYLPELHTREGVQNILRGTFMANASFQTSEGTITYADIFMDAAERSNVSPYHLAARVRMEQGTGGTLLTAGTVPGYYGYYNFFNVGAYTTSTASASVNGAAYASRSSSGADLRPWDSPYKAILGGSINLGQGYINKAQDTMYFEKFNVVNRSSGLYFHQYMTSVTAPSDESPTMKKAYSADVMQSALLFKIPVYKNMPAEPVPKPTGNAPDTPAVPTPSPTPSPTPTPTPTTTPPQSTPAPGSSSSAELLSSVYRVSANGYITGVTEQTTLESLKSKLTAPDGWFEVCRFDGTPLAAGEKVGTGTLVHLYDDDDRIVASYAVVIYGDIDGSGSLTVMDLLRLQKHLLSVRTLDGAFLASCDINRDGRANVLDLLKLQKHLLGVQPITQ